ncbi:MAG: membrane protein insertion efficiency factor YidD [Planctomycetota bacterium]|nr:MAG: membrane protein insertion efficiency factor YidD [Planctomycetota bacterium]REJ97429.1 MAG: membrane protein insertion efficiency factor YidD [Planctomycetota bacterium]REK27659.1 MAG: membrane protein insertion efficiency factor YidD [Planctomycetota bacterium]REK38498.1 MAG: membrane protein insertion efficiency factor YidD [Planctomycetota bacterium]
MRMWTSLGRLPSRVLVFAVRFYQVTISPVIGAHCRYRPTCSSYLIESVCKYGALRGTWRGARRIARCHPWGGSGYDPP